MRSGEFVFVGDPLHSGVLSCLHLGAEDTGRQLLNTNGALRQCVLLGTDDGATLEDRWQDCLTPNPVQVLTGRIKMYRDPIGLESL